VLSPIFGAVLLLSSWHCARVAPAPAGNLLSSGRLSALRRRWHYDGRSERVLNSFPCVDFEDGGNKEYVFFCLWEEGLKSSERPLIKDTWSRLSRLRSAPVGKRNLAQQTLEIVISGYDSPEKAEAAFRREIVK
jgi:hypothetical protein